MTPPHRFPPREEFRNDLLPPQCGVPRGRRAPRPKWGGRVLARRRHIQRRAPCHPFPRVDLAAGQGAPRRQDCLRCFPEDRHGLAAPFEALGGRRISLGAAPKRMHRYSRAATLRASLPLRHGGDSYSAPRLSPFRIKFCPRMRTTTSPGRPAGSSSSRPAALRLVKGASARDSLGRQDFVVWWLNAGRSMPGTTSRSSTVRNS